MKSKLIAYVTAGAIALTSLASAPAQAGPNDDLVKFLAGAVILGVIANEVNKNNNHATVTKKRHYKPKVHKPKKHRHQTRNNRHKPRQCLRQRWTDHGWKTFYGRKCMKKAGWHKHNRRGKWHRTRHAYN